MTIKQFIEKAIEGGNNLCGLYTNDEGLGYPTWEYNAEHRTLDFRQTRFGFAMSPVRAKFHTAIEKILLDPEAWKAVGKVEGWKPENVCPTCAASLAENDLWPDDSAWLNPMHRMIDALAEGRTIDQYLETL